MGASAEPKRLGIRVGNRRGLRVVVGLLAGMMVWVASSSVAAAATECAPNSFPWAACYNGPGHGFDGARAVAVSPDGGLVFVTGASTGIGSGLDYATVAYNASTGAQVWASRYNGPRDGDDQAVGLVVSPDGSTVFVTGTSVGSSSGDDYATLAFNATTGALLWHSRFNGLGNGADRAAGIAVSADGSRVYVTGQSYGGATVGTEYATVAYSAGTGAVSWVRRYPGPGKDADSASSVSVTPDGKEVVVTGTSRVSSSVAAFLTVAYNPSTGAQKWAARYQTTGGNERGVAVASSPDSSKVFVTGTAAFSGGRDGYATIAYNASTGAKVWQVRWASSGNVQAAGLAVSPDGSTVFVTGTEFFTDGNTEVTVAYTAATGARPWQYLAGLGSAGVARAIVVSPAGGEVFVTGSCSCHNVGSSVNSYFTDAYHASTSDPQFIGRQDYFGWNFGEADAYGLAVSPDSATVYTTGTGLGNGTGQDFATLAESVSVF